MASTFDVTGTPADIADTAPVEPTPPYRRRHLLALFVVVTAGRWALAAGADSPKLPHDEHAQLAIARVFGRAGHWTMADLPTWQPGLGLLLAPVAALVHDPESMYQVALVVNCVIGGVGALVFASLLRRTLRPGVVPSTFGLLASGIVSLSPALVRSSATLWAEPAVFVLVNAVILCLVETARSPRTAWPHGVVAWGALGYLFHGRVLPVAVVAGGLAAVLTWRRSRRRGVMVVAAMVVSLGIVQIVSGFVIDRVWDAPSDFNTVGGVFERLADPLAILIEIVGQFWYLQASSLTLFGLGAVTMVTVILGRRAEPVVDPTATRIVGIVVGVSVATSVLFMAGLTERAEFSIYGRYNDAVCGYVSVVGFVTFWRVARSSWRRCSIMFGAGAAALFAAAFLTTAFRGEVLRSATFYRMMVNGVAPFSFGPPRELVGASSVVIVLAVLVALTLIRFTDSPRLLTAVMVVLVATGALRIWDYQRQWRSAVPTLAGVTAVDLAVPDGEPIGFELVPDLENGPAAMLQPWIRMNSVQFRLPERTVLPWYGTGTPPRYTFGGAASAGLAGSADTLWADPEIDLVLWRVRPLPGD